MRLGMKNHNFEWRSLIAPRTLIFVIALFNFVWFFSGSSFVHNFNYSSGTKISFCYVCPWYWDWAFTNLPSLSLFAATCLLLLGLKGCVAALAVSVYQLIDGIGWFIRIGMSQRLQVYSESDIFNFWELLDVQYFLATLIFTVSIFCLVQELVRRKRTPSITYP